MTDILPTRSFDAIRQRVRAAFLEHDPPHPVIHAEAILDALDMSHGDLANFLRDALKALHPGEHTTVWTRDVYDDAVVYELSTNDQTTLFQRGYAIVDGTVTFGDPVKVVAVTRYVAVEEAERDGLIERAFSQDQRDAMATSGQAMSDGSLPIATKGDLKNAIQAYGRAANKAAAKKHIVKRAKAIGATDVLPEDWRPSSEADRAEELIGDLVPLVETVELTEFTPLLEATG